MARHGSDWRHAAAPSGQPWAKIMGEAVTYTHGTYGPRRVGVLLDFRHHVVGGEVREMIRASFAKNPAINEVTVLWHDGKGVRRHRVFRVRLERDELAITEERA